MIDEDNMSCPICLEIFRQPTVTNCGHSFCEQCIKSFFRKPCPVCRKKVTMRVRNYTLDTLCNSKRQKVMEPSFVKIESIDLTDAILKVNDDSDIVFVDNSSCIVPPPPPPPPAADAVSASIHTTRSSRTSSVTPPTTSYRPNRPSITEVLDKEREFMLTRRKIRHNERQARWKKMGVLSDDDDSDEAGDKSDDETSSSHSPVAPSRVQGGRTQKKRTQLKKIMEESDSEEWKDCVSEDEDDSDRMIDGDEEEEINTLFYIDTSAQKVKRPKIPKRKRKKMLEMNNLNNLNKNEQNIVGGKKKNKKKKNKKNKNNQNHNKNNNFNNNNNRQHNHNNNNDLSTNSNPALILFKSPHYI